MRSPVWVPAIASGTTWYVFPMGSSFIQYIQQTVLNPTINDQDGPSNGSKFDVCDSIR